MSETYLALLMILTGGVVLVVLCCLALSRREDRKLTEQLRKLVRPDGTDGL